MTQTKDTKRGDQAVRKFAGAMLHQLNLNEAKGDWADRPVDDSIWQVLYHFVKLAVAVKAEDVDPIAVQEYAADVGNEAMILVDNLKALDVIFQSSSHSIEKGDAMLITEKLEDVLVKVGLLPKGFVQPPVTPAQGNARQHIAEALAARDTPDPSIDPRDRALLLIRESHQWKSGDPENASEGSPLEKARMIAKWGMEKDEEMLTKAESALTQN